MSQKPDHPHQAAVHLMKALKCCQQCDETSEKIDQVELKQLQYRKNLLAHELQQLKIRGQSVSALEEQVANLEQLIQRLKEQNITIEKEGVRKIQEIIEQRKRVQNQELSIMMQDLEAEIQLNKQMKVQMENLMQRVRYLNKVNNELVYNFCNY